MDCQALAQRLIASALAADQHLRLPLALRIANRVPRGMYRLDTWHSVFDARLENVRSVRGLLPAAAKTRSR